MAVLNKNARFPPLGSLPFHPANKNLPLGINTWGPYEGFFWQQVKPYFQLQSNYQQNVLNSDLITIYFDTLATHADMVILDENSNIVATLVTNQLYNAVVAGNVDGAYGDQYYTFVRQFYPADYGLTDGKYYVAIQVKYGGDADPLTDTIFVSECLHIRSTKWDKTILFEYTNNTNDYDVLFEGFDGFVKDGAMLVPTMQFRCEGIIDLDPASHDVVFEDMECEEVKLQGIPYSTAEITVGGGNGLPFWAIDKVNRICNCDVFTVETIRLKKENGSTLATTKVSGFPMKTGSIKLRYNNVGNPGYEFSNRYDPDTFRYHVDEFFDNAN